MKPISAKYSPCSYNITGKIINLHFEYTRHIVIILYTHKRRHVLLRPENVQNHIKKTTNKPNHTYQMRKKLLLTTITLMAIGSAFADPIDMNKAKVIASRFAVDGEVELVTSAQRSEAKSRMLSQEYQNTAPYYIFSRGKDKGFVIVSGDDCLPEILGYTESGDFIEEKMPEQLLGWLKHYAEIIEEAQVNKAKSRAARVETYDAKASSRVDIPVLMTTHWHQSSPYNDLCPLLNGTETHAATGCVATAAAQVIYYFWKDNPDTLMAATPTYDYGAPVTRVFPAGTPMKWGIMQPSYGSSTPAEMGEAVATLMASVGAATWLTYGSSTSGQISNLENTFSTYFNMTGKCQYKSGISQSTWEDMIYKELEAGRPMVYTGYNDNNGGHAVVVDGYQASNNLFHFNFGWGGQGDGYYTVNDETGMNGFNQYQGMVYNISPKKQNLTGKIAYTDKMYAYRTNSIKVSVANNGTLPYSGVYIFANTNGTKPLNISQAKDKDTESVLNNDGTYKDFTFEISPSDEKTLYVYLTDNNCNILSTDTIDVAAPDNDIEFKSINIAGSNETETIEGKEYTVVYNNKATCEITLANNSDINYDGRPKVDIYASEDGGKTFSYVNYKSSSIEIGANEEGTMKITISNSSTCPIKTGIPYYAVIEKTIRDINETVNINFNTEDTIARFILKDADMEVVSYEDRCLKLKGHWDPNAFTSFAGRFTYDDAALYDLTEVIGINKAPETDKKNALIYVNADTDIDGENIVNIGNDGSAVCRHLVLYPGYDFMPKASFKAEKAEYMMEQEENKWYQIVLPFNASVPDGILAKKITSHSAVLGIMNKTENVSVISAGTPALIMSSDKERMTLTGENVTVDINAENTGDPDFIGTFVNTTTPEGAFLVNFEETQYFEPVDAGTEVLALRGYFLDPNTKNKFKANSSNILDPAYLQLGQAISECHDIYNEYSPMIIDKANEDMADSIAKAEKIYTERSFDQSSPVKNYAEALLEYAYAYRFNLKPETLVEIDCTYFIENPSFESKTKTGWETQSQAYVKSNSILNTMGVGVDGSYLLYNMEYSDSTATAISQTIENLPEGFYRLTAMLGTDTGYDVTLFAGDKETKVPGHKFGGFYLSEGIVDNVRVGEDGKLEIGVRDNDRWYKADNFRLTYLGNTKDDPTGIEEITNGTEDNYFTINGGKGSISISTGTPAEFSLYTVSGMLVAKMKIDGTYTFQGLNKGIYIVNGKKVAVY